MVVDHLEKFGFFRISSMVSGVLRCTQVYTVVSDRIVRAFNRSGATQAVALDIYKNFDMVWHTGLF